MCDYKMKLVLSGVIFLLQFATYSLQSLSDSDFLLNSDNVINDIESLSTSSQEKFTDISDDNQNHSNNALRTDSFNIIDITTENIIIKIEEFVNSTVNAPIETTLGINGIYNQNIEITEIKKNFEPFRRHECYK